MTNPRPIRRKGLIALNLCQLRAWLLILLGLSWALMSGDQPASAQFQGRLTGPTGHFIEPPRAISQRIEDAHDAIDQQRYGDAVVILGDLLARDAVAEQDADLAGQDFFLDADRTAGHITKSLLREAEEALGKLPPDGMEIYELRYGAQAQRMLDEATSQLNEKTLQEIVRRYSHTKAGRSALWVLANLRLSEGRPVSAVALLRRLASQPVARSQFGDPLLVRLAEAEHLSGREKSAAEHLQAAVQGDLQVTISGVPARWDDTNQPAEWLEQYFGQLANSRRPPEDATWIAGGGAAAIGPGRGSLPLSVFRWKVETTTSQKEENLLESYSSLTRGETIAPSWFPIKAGDHILMRTTERMMAVDFETGLRVWEYPWAETPELEKDDSGGLAAMNEMAESRELLFQRVWNDIPYGRMTSDGERVFLLMDLSRVERLSLGPFQAPAVRPSDTGTNTLVALELASEGKLLWKRGKDGNEPADLSLAGVFFLGPPLPVEGLLYQLGELAGDTYLFCLNPASGEELWRQQLMANEGWSVQSDPLRRIGGAVPAYADGVLVCPTAAGAVVAIDLASRAFLWGHYFPRNDSNILTVNPNAMARGIDAQEMFDRWYSGTPVIADGKVFVTPIEMDALYAYDLLTGEQVWPRVLRGGFNYLAGVRDGQFLLVGPQMVQAFDVKSGSPTWSDPMQLDEEQTVVGTGVFGDGVYLLPTSTQQILEVSLADGSIVRQRETEYPLGNLLAIDDNLISQSPTTLSLAYAEAPLAEMVTPRLEKDPDDSWALVRQGELLAQEGSLDQAIESFLRARELAPQDEEIRVRLVDSMLTRIRNGQHPDQETTDLLDSLIELNPQRVELLRLKVDDALAEKKAEVALEHLLALSKIVLTESQTNQSTFGSVVYGGANRTQPISLDAWIAARVKQSFEQANQSQRETLDSRVAKFLTPLLGSTPAVQRRAISQFGVTPVADLLREGLFTSAVDEGAWVDAERMVLDALSNSLASSSDERSDRWRLRLAELYSQAGFYADAKLWLAEIATRDQVPVPEDLANAVELQLQDVFWPSGVTMEARDDPNRNRLERNTRTPIEVVSRTGAHMQLWYPQVDRNGSITLRDPLGIDHLARVETGRVSQDMIQASFDRGLMVMLMPEEIVAVDLLSLQTRPTDAVLWRRPWRAQVGGNTTSSSRGEQTFFKHNTRTYVLTKVKGTETTHGAMRLGPVVGRKFFLLQDTDLIALDVVTNEELWRSPNHPPDAHVVADTNFVATVSPQEGVRVMRVEDGLAQQSRAWEPSELVVAAVGPHVLTRRNEPDPSNANHYQRVVRLRNPISDEVILSTTVEDDPDVNSEGAFATLVDGNYMVLLTVEKQLTIWDLRAGRLVAEHPVEFDGKLTNIKVVPWEDALIVAAVRRDSRDKDLPMGTYEVGVEHTDTDGPLYCVDLKDGSLRWTHVLDNPWGITINQPAGSPLLFLTRLYRKFSTSTTQKAERTLELLAIDTRDGTAVARVDSFNVESNFAGIGTQTTIMPAEKLVDVYVHRYAFRFSFAGQRPEELPLVYDSAAIEAMHEKSRQEGGLEDPGGQAVPIPRAPR